MIKRGAFILLAAVLLIINSIPILACFSGGSQAASCSGIWQIYTSQGINDCCSGLSCCVVNNINGCYNPNSVQCSCENFGYHWDGDSCCVQGPTGANGVPACTLDIDELGPYDPYCTIQPLVENWVVTGSGALSDSLQCTSGGYPNCLQLTGTSSNAKAELIIEGVNPDTEYFVGGWISDVDMTQGIGYILIQQYNDADQIIPLPDGMNHFAAGQSDSGGNDFITAYHSTTQNNWRLMLNRFVTDEDTASIKIQLLNWHANGAVGTSYFGPVFFGLASSCAEQDCNGGINYGDEDIDGAADMNDADCYSVTAMCPNNVGLFSFPNPPTTPAFETLP